MKKKLEYILESYYQKDDIVILACSGWADSMYLLYQLLRTSYKKNLVVCYFNHNTREQCKEEEDFLVKLWKKEKFKVEVAECDFDKIKKLYPSKSFEELAREKRYQFFDAVCNIYNSKYVLLGHHLNDKIETSMFNMIRWTKLSGLINMTTESNWILRPLLWIEKKDIYAYLEKNKLHYFEDESNQTNDYTRNYIRNELLPKLDNVHPESTKNISKLLDYFEELKNHIDLEIGTFLSDDSVFSLLAFKKLSNFLQKEVIREIFYRTNNGSTIWLSSSNIDEIIRFLKGKNNMTQKHIKKLYMFKSGDIITYSSKNKVKI